MKKTLILALAVLAGSLSSTAFAGKKKDKKQQAAVAVEAAQSVSLLTPSDSLSYALGMAQTNGLEDYLQGKFKLGEKDMPEVIRGLEDYLRMGEKAKAYAAGFDIANMLEQSMLPYRKEQFKDYKDSVQAEMFNKGFLASLKKDTTAMKPEQAEALFRQAAKGAETATNLANKKAGEDFLAENAKKQGVVTLPDGLQYKVITEGTGEKPQSTDRVTVRYEGRHINGDVFDSSYKRHPDTTTFGVTQVIKGWTEALQLMPIGSKWEVYIPYNLAYGEHGAGPRSSIKPYETLVFTVELVNIEKPQTAETATASTTAKKTGTVLKKAKSNKQVKKK